RDPCSSSATKASSKTEDTGDGRSTHGATCGFFVSRVNCFPTHRVYSERELLNPVGGFRRMPKLSPIRVVVLAMLAWVGTQEAVRADDWPQWLGPKRDGIWREAGILEKFPKEGPTIRWRQKIGEGYAGPAVAAGKVYIIDRVLPEGVTNPKNPFGRSRVKGNERVLCLDESNGKIL